MHEDRNKKNPVSTILELMKIAKHDGDLSSGAFQKLTHHPLKYLPVVVGRGEATSALYVSGAKVVQTSCNICF
jgi:hypothetical protein